MQKKVSRPFVLVNLKQTLLHLCQKNAAALVNTGPGHLQREAKRRNEHLQGMVDMLADMGRRGLRGRFAATAVPSEKVMLMKNVQKMKLAKKQVNELKLQLPETKSMGRDGESVSISRGLEETLRRAQLAYKVAFEVGLIPFNRCIS